MAAIGSHLPGLQTHLKRFLPEKKKGFAWGHSLRYSELEDKCPHYPVLFEMCYVLDSCGILRRNPYLVSVLYWLSMDKKVFYSLEIRFQRSTIIEKVRLLRHMRLKRSICRVRNEEWVKMETEGRKTRAFSRWAFEVPWMLRKDHHSVH